MRKLQGIKAVGFDLDETLVMNEPFAYKFANKVLAEMNRPPMDRKIHQQTWGINLYEAIKIRSPGINVQEFKEEFGRLFEEHMKNHKLDLFTENTERTLRELGSRGLYLFIQTGRDANETVHLTEGEHPIQVHFRKEDIRHAQSGPYTKPDPRSFQWLSEKGFKPNEVLFVGDSTHDAAAALGAGLHFVATLEGGMRKKEDFKGYRVDAFINRLPEILNIIA